MRPVIDLASASRFRSKVQQQADFVARRVQVAQQLGLVLDGNLRRSLQLTDTADLVSESADPCYLRSSVCNSVQDVTQAV